MKIPFGLTLSGLLLKGKDRERARIEYELSGRDKEISLLLLDYDNAELQKLTDYQIKKLNIDKKYNLINEFDYEIQLNNINPLNKSETEQKISELDIYLKYDKINNIEYCKQKNDILGKPWVAIKTDYDEKNDPDNLEIEVAYNKTFIEKMRQKGLPGDTDEEIAEQWLKLFMIANLEEEDLRMVDDEYVEDSKSIVTKKKIGDNMIIMG